MESPHSYNFTTNKKNSSKIRILIHNIMYSVKMNVIRD